MCAGKVPGRTTIQHRRVQADAGASGGPQGPVKDPRLESTAHPRSHDNRPCESTCALGARRACARAPKPFRTRGTLFQPPTSSLVPEMASNPDRSSVRIVRAERRRVIHPRRMRTRGREGLLGLGRSDTTVPRTSSRAAMALRVPVGEVKGPVRSTSPPMAAADRKRGTYGGAQRQPPSVHRIPRHGDPTAETNARTLDAVPPVRGRTVATCRRHARSSSCV